MFFGAEWGGQHWVTSLRIDDCGGKGVASVPSVILPYFSDYVMCVGYCFPPETFYRALGTLRTSCHWGVLGCLLPTGQAGLVSDFMLLLRCKQGNAFQVQVCCIFCCC